jgi:hypothetical protein
MRASFRASPPPAITDRVGAVLSTVIVMILAGVRAAGAAESEPSPASYLRIDESRQHVVGLQTAMRQFEPESGDGPVIWLGAVTHIGATNYYREFERMLVTNDLVLFESVLPHRRGGWNGVDFHRARAAESGQTGLQSDLARALELAFQLETVSYAHTNFINSDLSMEAVQGLMISGAAMARAKASPAAASTEASGENESEADAFAQLLAVMEGRGVLGRLVQEGVRLLAADARLQARTKLTFIEVLGRLQGDLARAQALPPELTDLLKVLIHRRNQKVVKDLRRALERKNGPGSVAVFYGAGHMADLERRVCRQLGYRPVRSVWLTAFDVNLAVYGITRLERDLIRFMTQRQMQMLQPAKPNE